MRVKLTDGREFRVSWRHINPLALSDYPDVRGVDDVERYKADRDKLWAEEERLLEALNFYRSTVQFALERIIALTECYISEVLPNTPITRDADPIGASFVSYKDADAIKDVGRFKEVGRKQSLTRALRHLFLQDAGVRKQFWDAYHSRHIVERIRQAEALVKKNAAKVSKA